MSISSSHSEITVSNRDIQLAQINSSCIDVDKNIWVKWGTPISPGGAFNLGPEKGREPYVFKANKITLRDKEHPNGVEMDDVWAMSMHGHRDLNDQWVFKNGQSVVDTIHAVNEELKKKGEDKLSIVLVCNNSESPLGIKIHDLNYTEGVYAIGESVHISGFMEEDGSLELNATAEKFENLEIEKLAKEINILDS